MKLIILSGISGSGKTTFLKALEDIGFFCVDHFPLVLLKKFSELISLIGDRIDKFAFVVDIREREFFDTGREVLKEIKEKFNGELIFLESTDEALMKRFKETRRLHPLYTPANIKEALDEERRLMGWIKDMADSVLDTSNLTPHELRRFVLSVYGKDELKMKINLMSFGYAYGIPPQADLVFDVRFLPNPYFVEDLREKNGLSKEIGDYISSWEGFDKFFLLLLDFLLYLIPLFEKEGKSYLTICIGCTGGKHRSVYVLSALEERLKDTGYDISTVHRDIDR
ncbi:MAG: RNase adapter RapZ [Syntrophorhabdaceae bacterium]|nr:RNase adapter RapZ [Syntrophorhabdaceae bacterium]